jgi:hypothetical protein
LRIEDYGFIPVIWRSRSDRGSGSRGDGSVGRACIRQSVKSPDTSNESAILNQQRISDQRSKI